VESSNFRHITPCRWKSTASFLIGLFLKPENGGDTSHRNVRWLSTDYEVLLVYPKRQTSSYVLLGEDFAFICTSHHFAFPISDEDWWYNIQDSNSKFRLPRIWRISVASSTNFVYRMVKRLPNYSRFFGLSSQFFMILERRISATEILCIIFKCAIQKLIWNFLFIPKVLRYKDKPRENYEYQKDKYVCTAYRASKTKGIKKGH
jgi:hypothetical protein